MPQSRSQGLGDMRGHLGCCRGRRKLNSRTDRLWSVGGRRRGVPHAHALPLLLLLLLLGPAAGRQPAQRPRQSGAPPKPPSQPARWGNAAVVPRGRGGWLLPSRPPPQGMKAPARQGSTFISALHLHRFTAPKELIAKKNPQNPKFFEKRGAGNDTQELVGCWELPLPATLPRPAGTALVSLTQPPAPRPDPGGSRDPRGASPCPAASAHPGAPAAGEGGEGVRGWWGRRVGKLRQGGNGCAPSRAFLTVVSFLRAAMRSSQVAEDFSKASCRLSSFSTASTVCP